MMATLKTFALVSVFFSVLTATASEKLFQDTVGPVTSVSPRPTHCRDRKSVV